MLLISIPVVLVKLASRILMSTVINTLTIGTIHDALFFSRGVLEQSM